MRAIKFHTWLVFGLILAFISTFFGPTLGFAGENILHLQGEAFSDPNAQAKKPIAWTQAPITYQKWAKGAELALVLDQQIYHSLLPDVKSYAKKNLVT